MSDTVGAARCMCESWGQSVFIELWGDFMPKLQYVGDAKFRDSRHWWRISSVCKACSTHWMIAGDIRVYDNYVLTRLSDEEVMRIERDDVWPTAFETFTELLEAEVRHGNLCSFFDEQDRSLFYTVQDLLIENSEISVERIAYLLNIHVVNAQALLDKARAAT